MKTINRLTGDDRRIALESIGRTASEIANKKNCSSVSGAYMVAKAMLEGVSMLDGALGPVVLLRFALTDVELAEELEALAADYRQRHADREAAEAKWRQQYVSRVSDQPPVSVFHPCEPAQNPDHDNPSSLSPARMPSEPPHQEGEND